MAKSDKLYSDSPTTKRGADGDIGISKPSDADAENMGVEGNQSGPADPQEMAMHANERREVTHRHVNEHLAMHHRQEGEHAANAGDPKELHKKHIAEHEEMQGRHSEEFKAVRARQSKSKGKE